MDESIFEKFPEGGLIKTVDEPSQALKPDQKVQLNRRANQLFNEGDLEAARRIFQTTGYSDGLIRVGERYLEDGRPIDALKMFKLAHDEGKGAELVQRAALAIRKMLEDEETT